MLGGGTFTAMNKTLNGAYTNYVSTSRVNSALADRGICAIPMELNWFSDGKVVKINAEDFETDSIALFGYSYDSDEMKPIREAFRHAQTLIIYRLNTGNKATCSISTAINSGTRGNDIKHVVAVNIDDTSKFDVSTYVGTYLADEQTVSTAADLVDNDFVAWKTTATLTASSGIMLESGSNGTVTGTEHQAALDALEEYTFNVLGCMSTTSTVIALYVAYTKRLRDKLGAKFVTVVYRTKADYIGIIDLKNKVTDATVDCALIPWVAGAEAGCAINKSLDNMTYDGEYEIDTAYKQSELEDAIKAGEFAFHKVGDTVNVLNDNNSFTSITEEMSEDFQLNQTVRVLDQYAIESANKFNTLFLGKVQNDADGRASLWSIFVAVGKELLKIRAIQDFSDDDITVTAGPGKRDVVSSAALNVVGCMGKIYSTIMVV